MREIIRIRRTLFRFHGRIPREISNRTLRRILGPSLKQEGILRR